MNVVFQEETYTQRTQVRATNKIGLFLVNKHIAKDEFQANVILTVAALTCFIISLFIMYIFVLKPDKQLETIPYSQLSDEQKVQIPPPIRELIESNTNN